MTMNRRNFARRLERISRELNEMITRIDEYAGTKMPLENDVYWIPANRAICRAWSAVETARVHLKHGDI
jgi:hypothetical protein